MLAAIVNSLSRHHIDASEDDPVSAATRDRGTSTVVPLSDNPLPLSPDSRSDTGRTQAAASRFDTRTRLLLDGPILATLLRLATPNVLVMFVQASVGLIETYFVARIALLACGRTLLWTIRIGPRALLRLGRRRTAALASAGEPDAIGDCGGWRLAGTGLER